MPDELTQLLRDHHPLSTIERPPSSEVWRRGRRARHRRRVVQGVGGVLAVVLAVITVPRTLSPEPPALTVLDRLPGSATADAGWTVLPPGPFEERDIVHAFDGWEVVLRLRGGADAAFDVTGDGTVAVFEPTTGMGEVRRPGEEPTRFDASFLVEVFPADAASHDLRLGPDGRVYLTSAEESGGRDAYRLTVFDRDGALVGTKNLPPSLGPVLFAGGRAWVPTDGRWLARATVGGALAAEGSQLEQPAGPTVTWVEDQGSFLNQVTGGDFLGLRYRLEQGGTTVEWTGPDDRMQLVVVGAAREDRPPAIVVEPEAGPPMVLVPRLDGLLAAEADPAATGLTAVGGHRALAVAGPDRTVWLYWLEPLDGGLALVRATPSPVS